MWLYFVFWTPDILPPPPLLQVSDDVPLSLSALASRSAHVYWIDGGDIVAGLYDVYKSNRREDIIY